MGVFGRVRQKHSKNRNAPQSMSSYEDFDGLNLGLSFVEDYVSVHSCKMTGGVIVFTAHTHTCVCVSAHIHMGVTQAHNYTVRRRLSGIIHMNLMFNIV